MEYEDPDMSEFIAGCAKQFCPWCGAPVIPNRMGRRKKFCSDRCRWAFWQFETRHREEKTGGGASGETLCGPPWSGGPRITLADRSQFANR